MRVLVVCTANQCRSPLAAAVLAARVAERGLPMEVASAGVRAVPGLPATPPTVDAARRIGLDLTAHTSAPVDPRAVQAADLVIGLERRHVQEVVLGDPAAFTKTFTFKELVRRGGDVGARASDQTVADWLATVHHGRRPTDLLGVSSDDDVADPTDSPAVDHVTTAEALDHLSRELLALLYP